jgi:hypothetical protein
MNIQAISIPKNGLCFINSLRQFFAEILDINVTLDEFKNRLLYHLYNDIAFLSGFCNDVSNSAIFNFVNDLFISGSYNNDFIDVLVNVSASYFGVNYFIIEQVNDTTTNLIPVPSRSDYTDTRYPRYNNINIILIRTGVKYGNVSLSHYDLGLPSDMNFKYEIARNNVLVQKNFKPHDDIIEVLQVNARSSYESRIIYKNWIIDDDQWLSNQHIYIIQNLIVKRFGSILNLTGLLHPNRNLNSE